MPFVSRPAALALAALFALTLIPHAAAAPSATAAARLQNYQQRQREQHRKLIHDLEELARWCDERRLGEAAAEIRGWAAPRGNHSVRIEKLPENVQPSIPPSLPGDERHWQTQLRYLRQEYAKQLYSLSRDALHAGFPSYAYHLVRETAHYDPDHIVARRLLGYVRNGDQWTTPFQADRARRRYVWHDRFGWLLRTHVERYENGERYYNGRWMAAAQEAEIRRDFKHAWRIETEHYVVKTNHSLERGVEVAKALEEFHDFFQQVFVAFFTTPEQMQKLFEASSVSRRPVASRQYEVHYYRTRDEYNERLIRKIPQIAQTNGLYYPADQVAYFYHDDKEPNDATLFHEASHQLFYESVPAHRPIAENAHFWAIEGIACYVESFRTRNGEYELGDPGFVRFYWARHRLLEEDYYVPLAQFAAMGMREFQDAPDFQELQRRYSQASGLAHFFMHYEDGRYRDAFLAHLSALYSVDPRRRDDAPSLPQLTGQTSEELDRQYQEYLREMESAADEAAAAAN